jgi:HK97 family phage prohead protease
MKEVRKSNELISNTDRKIEGYAIVFNSRSEDMGFFEEISSEALDGVIERSDCFALLNHDDSRGILARSKYGEGTLKLTVDDIGLRYEFEAPNTQLGDETLEMIKRGDIDGSSFAFSIAEGGEKWEKRDGEYYRTISKIERLYDISPVYQPAYAATTCVADTRGLDELKNEENELKAYFSELRGRISDNDAEQN